MLKAIKRIAKRIFIFILVIFVIYLVISNIDLIRDLASKEKINVTIDADAANGVDDMLSIYRILVDGDIELRGLTSAQWRLVDIENDSTVSLNHQIHRIFLEQFYKTRIPHPEGSGLPLMYSRNQHEPQNKASAAIIKIVSELPYGEKLNMICLGSATNLASALLERPDIADKIICFVLGPNYDPARRSWNKNDPITRLDLEAMDVLLNEKELEIHLLPANVASELYITSSMLKEVFNKNDTIHLNIMSTILPPDTITCSSLALVEAFRHPDLSTQKQLIAPPENTQRKIYVYTRIDSKRMLKEFTDALESFENNR
ncbi:nucleoside hydrolase [Bacteroidota bacterium]